MRPAPDRGHRTSPPPPRASEIGPEHAPMTTRRQLSLYEELRIEADWQAGSEPQRRYAKLHRRAVALLSAPTIEAALKVLSRWPGNRLVLVEVRRTLTLLDGSAAATDEYAAARLPFVGIEGRAPSDSHVHSSIHSMRAAIERVHGEEAEPEALDAREHAAAVSLAHVVASAASHGPQTVWLGGHGFDEVARANPVLVRLALDHPARGEELADFVAERGADPSLALAFIEGPNAGVLSNGLL